MRGSWPLMRICVTGAITKTVCRKSPVITETTDIGIYTVPA